MKPRIPVYLVVILCLLSPPAKLCAQGTAFTYQGVLSDSGSAASGSFDLRFALYDAASGGAQQGSALTNPATVVSNGQFTVTLDFGPQFAGANRWLEIGVRSNAVGGFNTLTPRQAITPSPYAIHAGRVDAAGIAGAIPPTALNGIYGNAVNFTNAGNSYAGNGSGLAALNASALAQGTVNDALLPPVISSDITGHAATADRVTGAATNTGKVFRVTDTNFVNSTGVLDRGGIYLGSLVQADGSPTANWRGGVHFMQKGWNGTVNNDAIPSTMMAAIQCYSNWSSPGHLLPTLHQWSRGAIRLENGFGGNATPQFGAVDNYLSLGNEDSNGRILIANVSGPLLTGGVSKPIVPFKTGYSQPLLFHAISSGATNVGLYQAFPAIQGFAPTNIGGVLASYGTIFPGELAFWITPPSGNKTNSDYFTQYPSQRAGGWMRTNGWQFFGRQIGSHRGIAATSTTVALDFMGDYAQTISLSQITNTFTAINVNTYRGATNYEAKIFRIKAGPTTTHLEWPSDWTIVSPSGAAELPASVPAFTTLRLLLESFGDELMASCSLGTAN